MPEPGPRTQHTPTVQQVEEMIQLLKDQIKKLEEDVARLQGERKTTFQPNERGPYA
jgi:hypothetical protein